jgi:outer membrane protein assembly factor BamB
VLGPNEKDIVRRKPLEGSGEWTHMYGGSANTACSGDQLVTPAMQLQWFGPPHARAMIDRHHRTSPPVYKNGRLFVPGEDRVMAVDAYNGTILWDIAIPDSRRVIVFRDSSHLAIADEALYVAAANHCLALNPATGKTQKTYTVPGDKLEWGYVARAGDFLLGTGVKTGSIRRAQNYKNTITETHWDFVPAVGSDILFAWKPDADRPTWTYRPKDGLILNPTLTIGNDRVYFLESVNPDTLKAETARARLSEMVGKGSRITALDLKTGKLLWSKPGDALKPLQHNVFLSYSRERLAIVGSRNSGTDRKKSTLLYDVHVLNAATGESKWSRTQDQKQPINCEHGEQERHPVIVGDRLYCEPIAYNLLTGDRIDWKWPWTSNARRGCGTLSASASAFYFRDENIRLFDIDRNKVEKVTTETRPGCWINILPVGGLLLVPEASSGCSCNFAVQTSLALIPTRGKP